VYPSGHARPDLDPAHVFQAQAEGRNADEQVGNTITLTIAGGERRTELEGDPLGRRRRLPPPAKSPVKKNDAPSVPSPAAAPGARRGLVGARSGSVTAIPLWRGRQSQCPLSRPAVRWRVHALEPDHAATLLPAPADADIAQLLRRFHRRVE
jgi:hypothetical protein